MAEVGFYHLTRSSLEEALPRLLEKAYTAGQRVLVRVGSEERLDALNRVLWTYDTGSFLPHGARGDGFSEDQPIYLTTGGENPNGARLLILADGAQAPDLDSFERCLDLFDGGHPEAVGRGTGALAANRGRRPYHRLLAAERARRLEQGSRRR